MRHYRRWAALALVVLIAGVAGYAAVDGGVGKAGATFSQQHQGVINGELGGVYCTPSGGGGAENLNIAFADPMLPGVPQTVTSRCTVDAGSSNADIYVVFNNPTALSALNNLGTYGEVHLTGNGTDLFDSANLNDRASTCGPFSPSGCWPLKSVYELASNVAPGNAGVLGFTFNYASKLSTEPPEGSATPWNSYPVAGQTTTNAGDGTGNGLPYKLVAVQTGGPAPTG